MMRIVQILLLLAVGLLMNGSAQSIQFSAAHAQQGREIAVTAEKFEFSPNPIRVKKGDHVKLVITAVDHEHGFKLDAFGITQSLAMGIPVTVEFTADKSGTFLFRCSVFCGLGHGNMKGTMVVEE
jgi:cytochrome c oxidase subunit 2